MGFTDSTPDAIVAVRRAVSDGGSGTASRVALTEPFHPQGRDLEL